MSDKITDKHEPTIAEKVQDVLNAGATNLRLVDVYDVYRRDVEVDDDDLVTLCFCDDRRTEDAYADAFGDDWNDAPYEHNAGIVSDRFEDVVITVRKHGELSVAATHTPDTIKLCARIYNSSALNQ